MGSARVASWVVHPTDRVIAVAPHGGLCSRFRARTFVRAHGRHAVKFSRRSRALGRHRGASESAVSTRCSGGPRHLDTPLLAPPRGAPIVHAGRLGTVRANYCMYSHSLRHVSASDGPIRHPKRHRSTHAGLRDSLAAHRPPRRRHICKAEKWSNRDLYESVVDRRQ